MIVRRAARGTTVTEGGDAGHLTGRLGLSDAVVTDTVRLTVRGEPGHVDLVVPRSAPLTDVARAYVEAVQATQTPLLTTTRGMVLDTDRSVRACGLDDGDLLFAEPPPGSWPHTGETVGAGVARPVVPTDTQSGLTRARGLAAATCAGAAALAAALAPAGPLRNVGAVVLLLAAF